MTSAVSGGRRSPKSRRKEQNQLIYVRDRGVKKSDHFIYTEAKVDVTPEIEQRVQWSAPAWAACCALCSISGVTSTLASVYGSPLTNGSYDSLDCSRLSFDF